MSRPHLQSDLGDLSPGAVVEITVSGTEVNAFLVDDLNYRHYLRGSSFQYTGGHYRQSPIRLPVPHRAHWHAVVDLGGGAGRSQCSVRVIRAA